MIHRRARHQDTWALVELGKQALERHPEKDLVIREPALVDIARRAISDQGSFAWVTELNGRIVAAVTAITDDMVLYERRMVTVWQFYSTVPGAGMPLLREFRRWVLGRRAIKRVVFHVESDADPRICRLLGRLGFREGGTTLIMNPSEVRNVESLERRQESR